MKEVFCHLCNECYFQERDYDNKRWCLCNNDDTEIDYSDFENHAINNGPFPESYLRDCPNHISDRDALNIVRKHFEK